MVWWRSAGMAVLAIGIAALCTPVGAEECPPLFSLQDANRFNPPHFDEYQVAVLKLGRPASARIDEDTQAKLYRSVLKEGATKGPNFAGQYTIVGWGCGSSCLQFAIVDARTGEVFFPAGIHNIATAHVQGVDGEEAEYTGLRFRLDSDLLITLGAINEDERREGWSFFKWTGGKLDLIRFIPRPRQECEPHR